MNSKNLEKDIVAEATKRLVQNMKKLDAVPEWVLEGVYSSESITGASFKQNKDGTIPLQGKGDLLNPGRFTIGPVAITESAISRTFVYNNPSYYAYIVKGGRAFVLDNYFAPSVVKKINEVLK